MGYESCVLINHDHYSQMADNPARFLKDMWAAMNKAVQTPQGFPGGMALYMDHASALRLIAVGKRHGAVLAQTEQDWSAPHHEDTQVALVRKAASKLGYRLVKKPPNKKDVKASDRKNVKTSNKKAVKEE